MLAGVALLGVWEGVKWAARKALGDELQEAKIKKLARIREETARAVREEMSATSSSTSSISTPTVAEAPRPVPPRVVETPRVQDEGPRAIPTTPPRARPQPGHDDQDLREALERAPPRRERNLVRFDQEFYMSEHGDRIHLTTNCHGLRHANQARMKRLRLCHYCDQRHPLHWNGPPQQGG